MGRDLNDYRVSHAGNPHIRTDSRGECPLETAPGRELRSSWVLEGGLWRKGEELLKERINDRERINLIIVTRVSANIRRMLRCKECECS